MLNMSAQEASPGLWSVAAASQNNHLRHVCICASCRRPIVEFALMQETARTLWEQPGGSNINLPSRIRTTELKFGWWLLTWLDSSTVFSMTEPAWSARSNSFRQLPLRLLLDGKNTVQQPPNRMGWQEGTRWRRATKGGRRKCGFDEALLQTPDTHNHRQGAIKLCPNFPSTADPLSDSLRKHNKIPTIQCCPHMRRSGPPAGGSNTQSYREADFLYICVFILPTHTRTHCAICQVLMGKFKGWAINANVYESVMVMSIIIIIIIKVSNNLSLSYHTSRYGYTILYIYLYHNSNTSNYYYIFFSFTFLKCSNYPDLLFKTVITLQYIW